MNFNSLLKCFKTLFYLMLIILLTSVNIAQSKSDTTVSIDFSEFMDSSHHWYDINEEAKLVEPLPDKPRYNEDEITKIADNILLFQKVNGGWPKNYDMRAILTDEQKNKILKAKNEINEATIDNGTTHAQIEYLAKVYAAAKIEKYKYACIKGIEYILTAQYPNGGWPQFYPDTSGYRKYITFNDGAMIGVMKVLHNIATMKPEYNFVSDKLRIKANAALAKGIDCILKCQIKENGKLNAWCQQHDQIDFHPQNARAFELASISNLESAEIVLFLMSIDKPDNRIINAVISSVKWFEESKIKGIKIQLVSAPHEDYKYHSTDSDRVVIKDSTAAPIWTRFTELGTHRPLFCNRDSKPVYSLAEVARERRTGYKWYTYEPKAVLEKYKNWKIKWEIKN